MTIMATHFTIVLGAWRIRLRFDIDEPRESELAETCAQTHPAAPPTPNETLRVPTWGRN
ncbi:MAG TPA: hypothetical protein VFE70_02010 [Candidatus Elarobacter sp.]|jgi:hypothetical protein|nr:hypothetical protein [Candidatus Elarobacter sp.]